MIRKICREVSRVMYIRCRLMGSQDVWFWLAKIINGSNQQVRTRRGVERGSVAMRELRDVQPVSDELTSQVRLANAITRLWPSVVGQSHLAGTTQVVGTSISVGIKIFSIVRGLGFVIGRSHGSGRLQLVELALRLLRRRKRQVIVLGMRRS